MKEEIMNFLKGIPLFNSLGPVHLARLADSSGSLKFDRGNERIGLALSAGTDFKQINWQDIDLLKGNNQKLLAGDFNGDRRDDIVVLNTGSGDWRVLLAEPGGNFTVSSEPWMSLWGFGEAWLPFASDVNGDGISDLIIYNQTGHWQVATSNGKKFIYRGDFGPWGASPKGVPLVADLNGDKRSDLIIIDRIKGNSLDTAISVMDR